MIILCHLVNLGVGGVYFSTVAVTLCCHWKHSQCLLPTGVTTPSTPSRMCTGHCVASPLGLPPLELFTRITSETWTPSKLGFGGAELGLHSSKNLALVTHCAKYQQFPHNTPELVVKSKLHSRAGLLLWSVSPSRDPQKLHYNDCKARIILNLQWVPVFFIFI